MKSNIIITCLAAAIIAVGGTGCATEQKEQAALLAQVKVSREQAEQAALTKVPDGTIKYAELESDNGELIWSFDVATPGSRNVTEVNVDAVTGGVISVATETPEQEAKEKD